MKTKEHSQLLEVVNEILLQTTRMDKAIDRLERKIDTLSQNKKTTETTGEEQT